MALHMEQLRLANISPWNLTRRLRFIDIPIRPGQHGCVEWDTCSYCFYWQLCCFKCTRSCVRSWGGPLIAVMSVLTNLTSDSCRDLLRAIQLPEMILWKLFTYFRPIKGKHYFLSQRIISREQTRSAEVNMRHRMAHARQRIIDPPCCIDGAIDMLMYRLTAQLMDIYF